MNSAIEEIMKNKKDYVCNPHFILEPHTNFKDIIYLESISYDDKFKGDLEDVRLKAEVLINYIDKLKKAKLLVSFYEDTVNALLQELPEDTSIKASHGLMYYIAKKPFDRYYYTNEIPKELCSETPCMEKENDR